jgi:hypothetical protein
MKTGVLLLLSLILLWPLDAQNVAQPDIVTDRPDITESGLVVPHAALQIENGLTWTLDHGAQAVDLSESLIRFGILDKTELRFGVPNYSDKIAGTGLGSGFGDLSFGVKEQLGPLPGEVDLSVIVAVSFPTGRSGVTSGGYDPFIKVPWSKELEHGWSVGGQQSVFWQTEAGRRNGFWEPTFYLERQLTKPWDAFVEYAGDYFQRGESKQILHFGTAYKITSVHQVDFHFGFGLNDATPAHFFAVGYAFRFDYPRK